MANLFNDYKYDGKQVPMAEVRVLHQACGTQILAIRSDTFKIFTPGLIENADKIRSIAPVTESYGSHARHKVDIYQSHAHNTGSEPILIFLYAGGFTRGNRTLEVVPDGLVYNNLGTYFASRGITTLVPDYRRVDMKKGGDSAVYPSGGEDISLLLQWLASSNLVGRGHRDVYILGNSAGAIHAATYLLDPQFHDGRSKYFESGRGIVQGALNTVGAGRNLTIQGAILLGLPCDYAGHVKSRREHATTYYGDETKATELSPIGLLSSFSKLSSVPDLATLAIPHLLVLTAEYDPPDEIVKPTENFVHKFNELFPNSKGIQYKVLKGHNHISPIAALMSGDQMGEEWAEQLVTWISGSNHIVVDRAAKEILRGPKKIQKEDTAQITVTDHSGYRPGDDTTEAGVTKEESTDLNREGDVGNTGKRETEVKEHQPKEHITPRDTA